MAPACDARQGAGIAAPQPTRAAIASRPMSEPRPAEKRRAFRKVLIANRGEIAVRVLRGLREMGIRGAVDLLRAPTAWRCTCCWPTRRIRIGPAPSRESYLRAEAIVELAVKIGADAIHPGYGFLSENARLRPRSAATPGIDLHRPVARGDRRDGLARSRAGA